jgi:hypothetical protein
MACRAGNNYKTSQNKTIPVTSSNITAKFNVFTSSFKVSLPRLTWTNVAQHRRGRGYNENDLHSRRIDYGIFYLLRELEKKNGEKQTMIYGFLQLGGTLKFSTNNICWINYFLVYRQHSGSTLGASSHNNGQFLWSDAKKVKRYKYRTARIKFHTLNKVL